MLPAEFQSSDHVQQYVFAVRVVPAVFADSPEGVRAYLEQAVEKHLEGAFPGPNTVSWPELRRGGVGTVVATLLPRLHRSNKALTFYQSREAAFAARVPDGIADYPPEAAGDVGLRRWARAFRSSSE